MDEEKQVLIKQQQSGDALREMQSHQGWQELTSILAGMYVDGLISLIEEDNIETRATLKSIENIAQQIKLKIDFGKNAAEELKSLKFNLKIDN